MVIIKCLIAELIACWPQAPAITDWCEHTKSCIQVNSHTRHNRLHYSQYSHMPSLSLTRNQKIHLTSILDGAQSIKRRTRSSASWLASSRRHSMMLPRWQSHRLKAKIKCIQLVRQSQSMRYIVKEWIRKIRSLMSRQGNPLDRGSFKWLRRELIASTLRKRGLDHSSSNALPWQNQISLWQNRDSTNSAIQT